MNFIDEIKGYTEDELELIISTQKDLYTEEEMGQLKELLELRKKSQREAHEAEILTRLPETIFCEKCDAPNPFSNENCDFCGYHLNKIKYYSDEYYEQPDEIETTDSNDNYTFHYIISFLIPLVGFIMGAIMLANNDEEKSSCGKACIILGIISMIVSGIVTAIFVFPH